MWRGAGAQENKGWGRAGNGRTGDGGESGSRNKEGDISLLFITGINQSKILI